MASARPTVVLTRPLPEALHWQQLMQARGHRTAVLPLLDIAPTRDPATLAALEQVRAQLQDPGAPYRAVMFVSPNAVRCFLAPEGMSAALQHAVAHGPTRVWAPGPGTSQALLQAGLPSAAIDSPNADAAQFDSESLWEVVAPQIHALDRILVVRGASPQATVGTQGSGREWLSRQLQARGATVEWLGVYTRQCPEATPDWLRALDTLRAAPSVWLFSSSEALTGLQQLAPTLDWQHHRALVTHPRIADAARAAGFGHVRECKPDVAQVCASIESWS